MPGVCDIGVCRNCLGMLGYTRSNMIGCPGKKTKNQKNKHLMMHLPLKNCDFLASHVSFL